EVPWGGPADGSVSHVSGPDGLGRNLAHGHPRECRGVQILQRGPVIRQDCRTADIVRTAVGNARRFGYGYRTAGLRRQNPRGLPAPERIPQGVPVLKPRKSVHPFGNEIMRHVSRGRTARGLYVVEVLDAPAAIGPVVCA